MQEKNEQDNSELGLFIDVMKESLEPEKANLSKQLPSLPFDAKEEKIHSFLKIIYTVAQIISADNKQSPLMQLDKDVKKNIVKNYINLVASNHFNFFERPSTVPGPASLRNKSGGCKIRHK